METNQNFDDIIQEKTYSQDFIDEILQDLKNLKAEYQLRLEDSEQVIRQLSRYNSHLENFITQILAEQESRLQDLEKSN